MTKNTKDEGSHVSPACAKRHVIGSFMSNTIYIIPPYNNNVRFFNVHPDIQNSRAIVEFLKGNDKDPDSDFIVDFQADCKIDGNKLKCIRSDYGQKWETLIDINTVKVDVNFL